MARAFDKNLFSATDAIANPESDTLFVNGETIAGYTDQPHVCRAIYVGVTGDVKVTMAQGNEVTFQGVVGGTVLPIQVNQVHATGTNATGIVALF